ncbi:VTT domain-containing protein [Prochlorococcus marinus XMU1411]|uniref:VTT domain-containing protein n=1 Tax=Prochlorococcus marinus TaxID=1219 RepID=UPI001AD9DA3B|nr:VTT domain-containing protein [Prochlorococcus marinus]MBO8244218.1 VTT domain-containing protein [Prochlorococcus marinus XMU1411]MBW3055304.1 hypothetical protein [Prochlorococcus marinus str. MU1411]MCR8537046.1 VTT domain-containing protein [Prochlorococcus marinus CUG1430]
MILEIIAYTFLIFITAVSPLPGLPFVILNYEQNPIIIAGFTTIAGGLMAGFVHYKFANLIYTKFVRKNFPKIYLKTKKYTPIIKRMSFLELFLLILSSVIPASLIAFAAGSCKIPYKKYFTCSVLTFIPSQFLYIFAASKSKNIKEQFIGLGFNKSEALIVSISIGCIIVFVILFLIRIIRNNLYKKSKRKKKLLGKI